MTTYFSSKLKHKATYGSYQCCVSALVSMRIQIQQFLSIFIRIQIQTQGFGDQKLEKICSRKSKLQEKTSSLKREHLAL